METSPAANLSPNQPPPSRPVQAIIGFTEGSEDSGSMLNRIGWRRPSPEERRWWLIQGAVILAAVLAIGTLMLLALR